MTPRNQQGYVYILTNMRFGPGTVLYTGVTVDLERRTSEHRAGAGSQFARRYNCHRLVFFEELGNMREAIEREKQIKSWSRKRKIELIESVNPEWQDLSEDWE